MLPVATEIDREIARLETLAAIEQRVLWLATSMVHWANRVRTTSSGMKVGGHQASSASMVSIMTALYFGALRAADRVSVKPHAAPVLHAIEYLLGWLDPTYLRQLRAFEGLQSYPSRTKDPVPVDFSTGSVGIGATAPVWSALAHRYLADRFDVPPAGRAISLVGDAELDEGAIWEAVADPVTSRLGEVLWIVDVNRQSLDRIVPDIAAGRIGAMFAAAGWNVITAKYGRELEAVFTRDRGALLRERIDAMTNEEYQRLLRADATELRDRLAGTGRGREAIASFVSDFDDDDLRMLIRDLGGHDLAVLIDAFSEADAVCDRPSVVFAYTIKGWRLPTEGHPNNHSALLTTEQWAWFANELGGSVDDPWRVFPSGSAEAELCRRTADRLARPPLPPDSLPSIPPEIGGRHKGRTSTQESFGRFVVTLARAAPEIAARVVTVSPDVASSTNLGGWINRVGVWSLVDRPDWFGDDSDTVIRWREVENGQHIELGIAECNLVGLLTELGLTWARDGKALLPIGSVYDPFVNRALEPWSFGLYCGAQAIIVGTPSGVTLAPEGGAHQSIITPSVGLEQPRCIAWEPAFGQDLEWTLLHALSRLGHHGGTSSYFRLTTRPIDQSLAEVPDGEARERRRRQALAGGYLLRSAERQPDVTLVGMGAVLPEVIAARSELDQMGIATDVVCVTSADLLFRSLRARAGLAAGGDTILDSVFPEDRAAPMVTVLDGHPHTLAFLGTIRRVPVTALGVDDFGQSGDIADLYEYFGIDVDTIVGAAFDLLEAL